MFNEVCECVEGLKYTSNKASCKLSIYITVEHSASNAKVMGSIPRECMN